MNTKNFKTELNYNGIFYLVLFWNHGRKKFIRNEWKEAIFGPENFQEKYT